MEWGSFDISFDFPQSAATRIGDALAFSYLITSSDTIPLTASLFDFLSSPSGGNGTWPLIAHIQSIGNGKSAWIGASGSVANPETCYLFPISWSFKSCHDSSLCKRTKQTETPLTKRQILLHMHSHY